MYTYISGDNNSKYNRLLWSPLGGQIIYDSKLTIQFF